MKTGSQRDICTPMFTAALITITKIQKQPVNRWMDKDVLYIKPMECYSAMKKENPAICYDLEEVWGHYPKWNRSDRERWILCYITCIYNLKKKKANSQKQGRLMTAKTWDVG